MTRMEALEAERREAATAHRQQAAPARSLVGTDGGDERRAEASTPVNATPSALTTRLDGPAPEVEVTKDISKRALIVAPVIIAICGVIWGGNGAWSALFGIASSSSTSSSPPASSPSRPGSRSA